MPQARLHVPTPIGGDREIELDAERAHYLGRVLRMKPGDKLAVFDGNGREHVAVVESIGRNGAKLKLDAGREHSLESHLRVRLVLGVSRGERMDMVTQKATELGVAEILPIITARTVVRLDAARAERRTAHWRKIVVGACEQCGRNRVPEVARPVPLSDFLARDSDAAVRIVLVPGADESLAAVECTDGVLELLIGPEGGLSEPEIGAANTAGFRSCAIGPRTLRAETAGIAALAAVQVLWGDLAG